ncbi:MAG: M20/M25/M40 family metallo-hydrolase [Henriciella sp.]|uniref:M20/M25/M40 family metallo-hydrolase n=1 Tax=Henriciella sp. TaxID=1968823 RepID=UPI003C77AC7F
MIRILALTLLAINACSSPPQTPVDTREASRVSPAYDAQFHDADRALTALRTLSSDEFEGRQSGTPGNLKARAWIKSRLEEMNVSPARKEGYEIEFAAPRFDEPGGVIDGTNLIAVIPGENRGARDAKAIVLSAHYDHLGIKDGEVYNGADDNASGVAALMEVIAWFQAHPPATHLIFAFFDAEEDGITGSGQFVAKLSDTEKTNIALNLNLDMVARADASELYAVGGYHVPDLVPVIEAVAADAPIKLLRGHETPDLGKDDWTLASDHAPFFLAGIPILYLGVEDHSDYHRPTDTFDKVDPEAFARSVDTIILMAEALDDWVAAEEASAD